MKELGQRDQGDLPAFWSARVCIGTWGDAKKLEGVCVLKKSGIASKLQTRGDKLLGTDRPGINYFTGI